MKNFWLSSFLYLLVAALLLQLLTVPVSAEVSNYELVTSIPDQWAGYVVEAHRGYYSEGNPPLNQKNEQARIYVRYTEGKGLTVNYNIEQNKYYEYYLEGDVNSENPVIHTQSSTVTNLNVSSAKAYWAKPYGEYSSHFKIKLSQTSTSVTVPITYTPISYTLTSLGEYSFEMFMSVSLINMKIYRVQVSQPPVDPSTDTCGLDTAYSLSDPYVSSLALYAENNKIEKWSIQIGRLSSGYYPNPYSTTGTIKAYRLMSSGTAEKVIIAQNDGFYNCTTKDNNTSCELKFLNVDNITTWNEITNSACITGTVQEVIQDENQQTINQIVNSTNQLVDATDQNTTAIENQTEQDKQQHEEIMDTGTSEEASTVGNGIFESGNKKFNSLLYPVQWVIDTSSALANVDAQGSIILPALFSEGQYKIQFDILEKEVPQLFTFIRSVIFVYAAWILVKGIYNLVTGGKDS